MCKTSSQSIDITPKENMEAEKSKETLSQGPDEMRPKQKEDLEEKIARKMNGSSARTTAVKSLEMLDERIARKTSSNVTSHCDKGNSKEIKILGQTPPAQTPHAIKHKQIEDLEEKIAQKTNGSSARTTTVKSLEMLDERIAQKNSRNTKSYQDGTKVPGETAVVKSTTQKAKEDAKIATKQEVQKQQQQKSDMDMPNTQNACNTRHFESQQNVHDAPSIVPSAPPYENQSTPTIEIPITAVAMLVPEQEDNDFIDNPFDIEKQQQINEQNEEQKEKPPLVPVAKFEYITKRKHWVDFGNRKVQIVVCFIFLLIIGLAVGIGLTFGSRLKRRPPMGPPPPRPSPNSPRPPRPSPNSPPPPRPSPNSPPPPRPSPNSSPPPRPSPNSPPANSPNFSPRNSPNSRPKNSPNSPAQSSPPGGKSNGNLRKLERDPSIQKIAKHRYLH